MKYASISSLVAVLASVACSNTPPPETPAAESGQPAAAEANQAPAAMGAAPATFAEQVALGQTLYGQKCAGCHGASGEGKGDVPAVVGLDKGALPLDPPPNAKYRKTQFKTVADIADFVVKNMPAKAPGSLTEEQYWAILAFDLKANGINLDQKLDGAVASTLTVPRK
jgi:mono/diheme cytochrome c family protein